MRILSVHITFAAILTIFFLHSCKKENNPCFKSTGKISSEVRSIPNNIRFIKLEDNINLYIEQDTFNSITIEAGENLLDFIDSDVKGDLLVLTNNNKCNYLRSYKKDINAYLTIRDIDSVECTGSGNLIMADTFYTDRIVFNMSRTTGDLDVVLHCESESKFDLHQGVSKVTASGYSRYNKAYNSGHGWFYMKGLQTYYSQLNSKSTGDIIAGESEIMFILLNGSGNIVYYGNPNEIQIWEHFGDGKLIKN